MVITITPEDLVWNQDALDRTHILLKIKFEVPGFAFRLNLLQNIKLKILLATKRSTMVEPGGIEPPTS